MAMPNLPLIIHNDQIIINISAYLDTIIKTIVLTTRKKSSISYSVVASMSDGLIDPPQQHYNYM